MIAQFEELFRLFTISQFPFDFYLKKNFLFVLLRHATEDRECRESFHEKSFLNKNFDCTIPVILVERD